MKQRLAAFFFIAFAISWGVPGLLMLAGVEIDLSEYAPLYYLAVWAPAIAAIAVVAFSEGFSGLLAFLRRMVTFKGHWGWYLAVLIGVPLMNLAASFLAEVSGKPALVVPAIPIGSLLAAALMRATAGPVEEFGWRGFALPMLQRRMAGWQAALLLGFIWGLWHMPAYVIGMLNRNMEGELFTLVLHGMLSFFITSMTMTLIYNLSRGSVPLMFLFHWMSNFPYPWEGPVDIMTEQNLIGMTALAVLLVAFGRQALGRKNLPTDVLAGREFESAKPAAALE